MNTLILQNFFLVKLKVFFHRDLKGYLYNFTGEKNNVSSKSIQRVLIKKFSTIHKISYENRRGENK